MSGQGCRVGRRAPGRITRQQQLNCDQKGEKDIAAEEVNIHINRGGKEERDLINIPSSRLTEPEKILLLRTLFSEKKDDGRGPSSPRRSSRGAGALYCGKSECSSISGNAMRSG